MKLLVLNGTFMPVWKNTCGLKTNSVGAQPEGVSLMWGDASRQWF